MNTDISNLLAKGYTTPALCGVVAFAIEPTRYFIGRIAAKRRIEAVVPAEVKVVVTKAEPLVMEYDPELEVLLDEEERIMNRRNEEREADMIAEMTRLKAEERAAKEIERRSQEIPHIDEGDSAPRVNVFMAPTDDDWNYELELSQRDPELPYVLHVDEYLSDEMGFKQETVTYYAGDDIMADMQDVPIYNWGAMMGTLKWGHGSKDKNVVYIRNEKMHKEWEVLLHRGSYEIEVAGLQLETTDGGELRHSLRKFRDD